MTAIMDRDVIDAVQSAAEQSAAPAHRAVGAPRGRVAARARGVSPRLSKSRVAAGQGGSTTVSNATAELDLRTDSSAVRVVGARGAGTRTVERHRVRPNIRSVPRGVSRPGGCARRAPRTTLMACLVAGVGTFVGLVVLFGGSGDRAEPQTAPSGHPALTSIVTVRAGQDLQQIAHEIAPDRPSATVAREIAEMNGLEGAAVHPGQSLVTPRY